MTTTTVTVLTQLLDQVDNWRTVAEQNRRMARPGHETQQWDQLSQNLSNLRRQVRQHLAHAQEANP